MLRYTCTYPPTENIEKLEKRAKTPDAPCQKSMLAWIDCMKGAQASYAEEGNDTSDPKQWAYYHLKKCLHPYIDARECTVEKKGSLVREMQKHLTPEQKDLYQKRLRYAAHKSVGLDQFDELWNPDMDYSGYFKAYRKHMENQFILEKEFLKEREGGGDPVDPGKYLPKKFWKNTQVYFDEKDKQKQEE